jgi:hypothetical protein
MLFSNKKSWRKFRTPANRGCEVGKVQVGNIANLKVQVKEKGRFLSSNEFKFKFWISIFLELIKVQSWPKMP